MAAWVMALRLYPALGTHPLGVESERPPLTHDVPLRRGVRIARGGYTTGAIALESNPTLLDHGWLLSVDLETGVAEAIGRTVDSVDSMIVYDTITGLAFDPTTGVLYGVDDSVESGYEALLSIDTQTGIATRIGILKETPGETPGNNGSGVGLASTSFGRLYASWGASGSRFIEIDKLTGLIDIIGISGVTRSKGLATDEFDVFFGIINGASDDDDLAKIDPMTGFGTAIGPLDTGADASRMGMATDATGQVWGIEFGNGSSDRPTIYRLDKVTGSATEVATEIVIPATSQFAVRTESLAIPRTNAVIVGTGNPWLSGMPEGSTDGADEAFDESPAQVEAVDIVPGEYLAFSVTGGTSFAPGCPIPAAFPDCDPPDGTGVVGNHGAGATNGIADLIAPYSSLVGVFLDDTQPDTPPTPGALDFGPTGLGTDFAVLLPELKQPFFIGDGQTSGLVEQAFRVPTAATRLFLGTHDGVGWSNNSGSLAVTIRVPEPAKVLMLGAGVFFLLVVSRRRAQR